MLFVIDLLLRSIFECFRHELSEISLYKDIVWLQKAWNVVQKSYRLLLLCFFPMVKTTTSLQKLFASIWAWINMRASK